MWGTKNEMGSVAECSSSLMIKERKNQEKYISGSPSHSRLIILPSVYFSFTLSRSSHDVSSSFLS